MLFTLARQAEATFPNRFAMGVHILCAVVVQSVHGACRSYVGCFKEGLYSGYGIFTRGTGAQFKGCFAYEPNIPATCLTPSLACQ